MQLDGEHGRRERPAELARERRAIAAGGAAVLGLRHETRARRQRVKRIASVDDADADQQTDVRGIARADEGDGAGAPGVLLTHRRHGPREGRGAEARHE